jgi:hypothetical protein
MSKSHKGLIRSEEHRKNLSKALTGRKLPAETKKKISESVSKILKENYKNGTRKSIKGLPAWNKGVIGVVKMSEETKEKMSRNNARFWLGKKMSDETKSKLSELNKLERHPQWRCGLSFLPYGWEFNSKLKKEIKELYGNKCIICGNTKKLSIHHIDYNKHNNRLNNLVPLCISHHSQTNFNRGYWEKYLFTLTN